MERIKRALLAASKERELRAEGLWTNAAARDGAGHRFARLEDWISHSRSAAFWFGCVVAVMLVAVLARGSGSSAGGSSTSLGALEVNAESNHNANDDWREGISTADRLGESLASANARVEFLTESVTVLEEKLMRVHALVEAMDATSISGTVNSNPGVQEAPRALPAAAMQVSEAAGKRNALATAKSLTGAIDAGPWAINLAAFPDKVAADRFLKNAESRNIPVEDVRVTVNGKQFWRMQVTGFLTADEARAKSAAIKRQLGLEDVWISKR